MAWCWTRRNWATREDSDTPDSMYYDMRLHQLRFSGLEKGDVVELEYSLVPKRRSAPYNGYFGELVLFAGRGPELLKRYVLIAPAAQKIFVHAEKVAPASVSARDGSQVFLWESQLDSGIAARAAQPRRDGDFSIRTRLYHGRLETAWLLVCRPYSSAICAGPIAQR